MEHFLARLQDNLIVEGGKDMVCWLEIKCGTFSIKPLYSSLEVGRSMSFPICNCVECLGST